MEVLSGPWADLALLLRQTALLSDQQQDTLVCLLLVVLFLSVSLLLLQLIVYLSWKLRQAEAELAAFPRQQDAIHRQVNQSAHRRRSFGSHSYS
ncbi:hypothetical protein FQA47_002442 [Oryzias melastigma]|uniref:Uncharacterized protein n=1 Tax=Oryzias melastigma TaxID=30732 RepID=A0A834FKF7_ORYME|nr:hypothetical protein FQA47_002442 [Oryzias melastigma]